jgi:hypothetical protein
MDYTNSERERFERIFRANHLTVHTFARRRVAAEAVDDVVSERLDERVRGSRLAISSVDRQRRRLQLTGWTSGREDPHAGLCGMSFK